MDLKTNLDYYVPMGNMLDDTPKVSMSEPSMIGSGRDRKKIMKAAADLMDGERAQDYGDACEMHRRIAAGWSEILGVKVEAHEVALCMVWVKTARLVETPDHDDSYVDGTAYFALAGEIQAKDSAKRG